MKSKIFAWPVMLALVVCLATTGARGGVIFTNLALLGSTGAQPDAGLALGADGNFYGVAAQGGEFNQGTVFRVSPDGSDVDRDRAGICADAFFWTRARGKRSFVPWTAR